jgi:hypothetical protein
MSQRRNGGTTKGNMRLPSMVDFLKSFIQELLPAWLSRKAVNVDVRTVEQPPFRDLIGAAPPVRYRGPVRPEIQR